MFKKIFKNMSQESTENIEKETVNEEIVSENQEILQPELSVEEQLQEDLAKEKDKFLRLFAEYDNFKKRTTKERIELFKTANQEVLQSMLPVLDDFDRAMAEILKSEDESLVLS
jgi:molecular chaperone GrpE